MASELKSGVILSYISSAVSIATSFFLFPFVISTLGVEEYGIFVLSHSIIGWLALTDLGLGSTVRRYVVTYRAKQEPEQEAHFLGQSMLLYSFIALVTLTIGVICFFYLDTFFPKLNTEQLSTLEILYWLTLSNMILAIPLKPLSCVPDAYQKFIIPGTIRLITSLLNTGLTVTLLLCGFRAIGLTVLSVGMGVASLLWCIYYTLRILGARIIFRRPDWLLYREIFTFSIWVFLSQIMDMLYWQAGSPILANLHGPEAVSVFTLGVTFSHHFMVASTAISGVIGPRIMHMTAVNASKKELTRMMIRTGRLQLAVLITILMGFCFLGLDFLTLWVGDSMKENTFTVWIGTIILLSPLVIPLTQVTGISILMGLNIHRGRALILIISSTISVVAGYFLSRHWGPLGMFIGTASSIVIGQGILINSYYKLKAGLLIGMFFRHTYLPIITPLFLMVVLGILLTHLMTINNTGHLFIAIAIYGSMSAAIIFFTYLNREEREMFLSPLKKIFR